MTTEVDELKQQLRMTEKLLADANGRIKAVELDAYETKRNAKISLEQAEALKAETDAGLQTAVEQLKVAHAIGLGIFGMADLGRAYMARLVAASRMLHRENKNMELFTSIIDAVNKKDSNALAGYANTAREKVATVRQDQESTRLQSTEIALAFGFGYFEQVWQDLLTKENTSG